jgi:hypothetical protein
MKTSTGKQKVKMGASVILALAMGAFGINSFNAPAQAAEAQIEQSVQDSSGNFVSCGYRGREPAYVYAYTYVCYQVQAAAQCYKSGAYSWVYAQPGKTSTAYCPSGSIATLGAVRVKVRSSSSPWSSWQYF